MSDGVVFSASGSQPPRDLVWREQAEGACKERNIHRPTALRILTLLDEKADLAAEVARLRTALEEFAEHDESCPRWHYNDRACDCGLAEALRAQDGEPADG